MAGRVLPADAWLRGVLGLGAAHAAFLAIVWSRPGLVAVVLWYVAPILLGAAAAWLLGVALVRSWRHREAPGIQALVGYALLLLVMGTLATFRTFPSSYDDRPSRIPFRLPLDGPVTVAWGGSTRAENYHTVMPDQRWAYDLLVTSNGLSHTGAGTRVEDYYAWGRDVRAPAAGIVRVVHDGEPDGPIGQRRILRAFGNHVVLEVAPGEYLFIAHLQRGSVAVAAGARVEAGTVLGRVGNSGNSTEPHVHVHLQDSPAPSLGEAIPFAFRSYRVNGRPVAEGMPRGGFERREGLPGWFTGDVVEHGGAE